MMCEWCSMAWPSTLVLGTAICCVLYRLHDESGDVTCALRLQVVEEASFLTS